MHSAWADSVPSGSNCEAISMFEFLINAVNRAVHQHTSYNTYTNCRLSSNPLNYLTSLRNGTAPYGNNTHIRHNFNVIILLLTSSIHLMKPHCVDNLKYRRYKHLIFAYESDSVRKFSIENRIQNSLEIYMR